jgi:hypothetical protein
MADDNLRDLSKLANIINGAIDVAKPGNDKAHDIGMPIVPSGIRPESCELAIGYAQDAKDLAMLMPGICFEVFQGAGLTEEEHDANRILLLVHPKSVAALTFFLRHYYSVLGVNSGDFDSIGDLADTVADASRKIGLERLKKEKGNG